LEHNNHEFRQKEIQKTIDIFLNKDIDKNLKDNIRFSIMKILTLKFLKKCSLQDLKEIFVKNYKVFFEIVKGNTLDSSLSYEMKFILILEKYLIIFLFVCFSALKSHNLILFLVFIFFLKTFKIF
jgi:hypothetical protein